MRRHQSDFGGFESRFLGVTLEVESPEVWETVEKFVLADRMADPDEVIRLPVEDRAERLSALTTLPHEVRHFHDFLLSPHGASVARARVMVAVNGAQVLALLDVLDLLDGVTHVPVPLALWWRKGPDEQAAEVARWSWLLGGADATPIEVPRLTLGAGDVDLDARRTEFVEVSRAQLDRLVEVVDAQYGRLRRLLVGAPLVSDGGARFENRHVLEGSAAIVQIQWAYNAYGLDAANALLELLVNRADSTYGQAMQLALKMLDDKGLTDVTHVLEPISAMLNWSLLSLHAVDEDWETPARRFARLVVALAEEPRLVYGDDLRTTYGRWDELAGGHDCFGRLEESLEFDDRHLRQLAELQAVEGGSLVDPFLGILVPWAEAMVRARKVVVAAFLSAPEDYVFPERYADSQERLVAPPLRVRWNGAAIVAPKEEFERAGWRLKWMTEYLPAPGQVAVGEAEPPVVMRGEQVVPSEVAFDAASLFTALDVLLSPSRSTLRAWDYSLASALIRDGVSFINVIGG